MRRDTDAVGRRAPRPARRALRAVDWRRLPLPALGAVVVASMVAGGVAQAAVQQRADERAAAAAELAAVTAQARVDAAATERLSGQAAGYLAAQRTAAYTTAATASRTAQEVLGTAGDLVSADELAGLQTVLDQLDSALDQVPDAESAIDDAVTEATDVVDLKATTGTGDTETTPARVADLVTAPVVVPDNISVETVSSQVFSVTAGTGAVTESVAPTDSVAQTTATTQTTSMPAASDVASFALVLAAADLDVQDNATLTDLAAQVSALSDQLSQLIAERAAERAAAEAAAQAAAEAAARVAAKQAKKVAALTAAAKTYPNGEIPAEYLCGVSFQSGVLLRCDAAKALEAMNAAYKAETGTNLKVVSSYRTVEEQELLVETKGTEIAAEPGQSNHGLGIAVDFSGAGSLGQFDAPVYLWLQEHAADYGWTHPTSMEPGGSGPQEPWHWEYRG